MIERTRLWLIAVRDGFVMLLPLTALGIGAVLLNHFPWAPYRELTQACFGPDWVLGLKAVERATIGIFGLALSPLVAVRLSRLLPPPRALDEHLPPLAVGTLALANYLLCGAALQPGQPPVLDNLLQGMLVGVATAELLQRCGALRGLWPAGLPFGSDGQFFHALRITPAALLSSLSLLGAAWLLAPLLQIDGRCFDSLLAWINARADARQWLTLSAVLLNQLAWSVGIPGGHLLDMNAATLFAPVSGPPLPGRLWRPVFDSFVLMGGSGATFGLMLAMLFNSRPGATRRLAWLSLLPGSFNINETLIFGLPLALNRHFLPAFIGVPVLMAVLTLLAFDSGWLSLAISDASLVPWTTPPLVSGWLLTGSWRGVAFQALLLTLSAALYWPLVSRWERRREALGRQTLDATVAALLDDDPGAVPPLRRHDGVGGLARELLGELRRALAAGTLQQHYQPQVDTAGRCVGVEALLRWQHPRHGPVSPAAVVALAEQGGLIDTLGDWALETALACKARWNRLGLHSVVMAVNLSPSQLRHPDLAVRIEAELQRHGLRPQELELELTETRAVPALRDVDDTLQALARTGVRLSMDDFGMGYSSLLQLRRIQVHTIKIDGSITRDIVSSRSDADIVRSIAQLGQALGVQVLAEYVETDEQRRRLVELGCALFQGFLHSRPLPADECAALLRSASAGQPSDAIA
ncbi:MAG: PTS sugar transporter subunit IIC/EAL domain-containing protein [Burkholderiales bacterium]|nr:PTS sugar transporter subunit IIC/EAL domain-containing protein [Burkholderiales bacterium]